MISWRDGGSRAQARLPKPPDCCARTALTSSSGISPGFERKQHQRHADHQRAHKKVRIDCEMLIRDPPRQDERHQRGQRGDQVQKHGDEAVVASGNGERDLVDDAAIDAATIVPKIISNIGDS